MAFEDGDTVHPGSVGHNPCQKINDLKVIVGLDIPRLKNCSRKKDVEYDITKTYIHSDYDFPYFDVGILELQLKLEYLEI